MIMFEIFTETSEIYCSWFLPPTKINPQLQASNTNQCNKYKTQKYVFQLALGYKNIFEKDFENIRKRTLLWLNSHLERFTSSTKLNPHLTFSELLTPTYTVVLKTFNLETMTGEYHLSA